LEKYLTLLGNTYRDPTGSLFLCLNSSVGIQKKHMNGRLDKVAMTNRLMQLKRELHYKCEIGEKGKWECIGANEYLNKTFDVLDEYWQ
tara:strand:+ start:73 stop:336 length:264 start_codon:yes stop_codon:yes gene_type:complete